MQEKRLPIAMEKAECPICGLIHSHGGTALGTVFLSDEVATKKERAVETTPTHHHVCDECQAILDKGYLALIEYDPKMTHGEVPFRTGRLLWLRERAFQDFFDANSYEHAKENKAAYLDPEVFQMIADVQKSQEDNQ